MKKILIEEPEANDWQEESFVFQKILASKIQSLD